MQASASDGPPMRYRTRLSRWRLPPRQARVCGTGSHLLPEDWDTCVERIPLMNPADVAQSALPIASSDVSLIALFLQAHWIVKSVMVGLLACAVWGWGMAGDKEV